jgi:hypothetical protein
MPDHQFAGREIDDALTFRFAVDKFGVEAFDNRLIAVDEFHYISANPDNKLGLHLGAFVARDKVHIVAMTGSFFRADAEAVLAPQGELNSHLHYYEQLNGYQYLKQLDIGYFFHSGFEDILAVLNPAEKTITHIPSAIREKAQRTRSGRWSISSRRLAIGRAPTACRPRTGLNSTPPRNVLRNSKPRVSRLSSRSSCAWSRTAA